MLVKAPETTPLPMELACTTLQFVLPVLRAIFVKLYSMEGAFCGSGPNQRVLNAEIPQRLHGEADSWPRIKKRVKRNVICVAGLEKFESAGC